MGFLRLITNSRVMELNVVNSEQAWQVLGALLEDDRIRYVAEPPGLEDFWKAQTLSHKVGSNFWTDAYLAAFAAAGDHVLVTFDRGFAQRKDVSVHLLH
jgi:predicted nucleic acid-binding protein